MNKQQSVDAIRANLQVVYNNLFKANQDIAAALSAINEGKQNLAIGCMLEVPDRLEAAKTFCDAIIRIHRYSR